MIIGIVGARSRSAIAFRRFLASQGTDFDVRHFVRLGTAAVGGARGAEVAVTDYEAIDAAALEGCNAVINFVGVVTANTREELNRINVAVPERLVRASGEAGVRQFVQMSSLSLHGPQRWIDAATPLAPTIDYGRSKLAAEQAIAAAAGPQLTVALLRVPTIYGPAAPSKLSVLARILRRTPLFPSPAAQPRRSVISHVNLSRTLLHVVRSNLGGVLYAADPQPFTLSLLAEVLPNRPWIVPLPAAAFKPLSWLAPGPYTSLYESGEVDSELLLEVPGMVSTRDALVEAFGSPASS